MNLGVFAVLSHLSGYEERRIQQEDFAGVARQHPVASAAMAVFLCSLIGIPFTAGFFGKFYVFASVIHSGHWALAIVGLLNSGLAAFYYLRFLARLYAQPEPSQSQPPAPAFRPAFAVGVLLLVLAVFALGIFPNRVLQLVRAGATESTSCVLSASMR
jgi:NADH-quinone oxidoreductase subunit N